jgi:small basic protein
MKDKNGVIVSAVIWAILMAIAFIVLGWKIGIGVYLVVWADNVISKEYFAKKK